MNNIAGLQDEEKLAAAYPFANDGFFNNNISGESIFQKLPDSNDSEAPAFSINPSGY
jgi:hypothetical protein